jgi:hypothetical protein
MDQESVFRGRQLEGVLQLFIKRGDQFSMMIS